MMTFLLMLLFLFDQWVDRTVLTYAGVIKPVYQVEKYDCGLACVCTLASHYGYHLSLNQLRKNYPPGSTGLSFNILKQITDRCGIESCCKKIPMTAFQLLTVPVISHLKNAHYVVFLGVRNHCYHYFDPARGFCITDAEGWNNLSSGVILLPLRGAKSVSSLMHFLTSGFGFALPFAHYFLIDFILSVSLFMLSLYFNAHSVLLSFIYSFLTALIFSSASGKLSARIESVNNMQPSITPYLLAYQLSVTNRLIKKAMLFFFPVFFFAAGMSCFTPAKLILLLMFSLVTLWFLFFNADFRERYYMKRTYRSELSAMLSSDMIVRKTTGIKFYILTAFLILICLYSCFDGLAMWSISVVVAYFLSRWMFNFYLDLKEFLFIFNAE
ncbi:cysteine peptidase family C39 domain-containing protein [Erwinia mallotivora]|uniref:cysteine peptidase family C39 domain-containing protein n=1 Tax=Erwinia mallotivora TaxID=69222 RepID=UPI0021C088BA|nr:cysteine peptidase family C39 domain-containing protein [Erwinia mallotivora]